jgi:hypothetical protein
MLEFDDGLANPGPKRVSAVAPLPGYAPGGLQTLAATAFNRPADTTAYASGDLVANSTTAGSVTGLVFPLAVRAAGEAVRVERLRLRKSGAVLTNASFRVYLFRALPTLSVGDNAALNASSVLAMDDVQYLSGWFDVTMDRSATAGARGAGLPNSGSGITLSPASGTSLYGLIEATAAYTPASGETFNATLEGVWS